MALFPLPDAELRLLAARVVGDLQLDEFRAQALVDDQHRPVPVVPPVRPLAGIDRDQLMLTGLQVAHVQALHPAAMQGLDFALGIQIVSDVLVVRLELHGVLRPALNRAVRARQLDLYQVLPDFQRPVSNSPDSRPVTCVLG